MSKYNGPYLNRNTVQVVGITMNVLNDQSQNHQQ